MKVTIEKVVRSEKDTKFGTKRSVGLKIAESTSKDINGATVQTADRWLNCLYDLTKDNGSEGWVDGDKVDIDIKVNGEYLNFRPASQETIAVGGLEERVAKIEKHLGINQPDVVVVPEAPIEQDDF